MKTIGLLGGISWHSTMVYYQLINELTNKKLGGNHSAKMQIYSFNFQNIRDLHAHSEKELGKRLVLEAQKLEDIGADCLLIGANTLHMFYDDIQEKLNIPVLHIAEATGEAIKKAKIDKVGLLGTIYTMETGFYIDKLAEMGIKAFVPDESDRKIVNDVIYQELVKGKILEDSKKKYLEINQKLIQQYEIEGLILGCTEIPLLIKADDLEIPDFNTTELHAMAAVDFATS